jgi:hypothetical protein
VGKGGISLIYIMKFCANARVPHYKNSRCNKNEHRRKREQCVKKYQVPLRLWIRGSVKNLGMVALNMIMWAVNVRQKDEACEDIVDNRNNEQGETGETEYHWL